MMVFFALTIILRLSSYCVCLVRDLDIANVHGLGHKELMEMRKQRWKLFIFLLFPPFFAFLPYFFYCFVLFSILFPFFPFFSSFFLCFSIFLFNFQRRSWRQFQTPARTASAVLSSRRSALRHRQRLAGLEECIPLCWRSTSTVYEEIPSVCSQSN